VSDAVVNPLVTLEWTEKDRTFWSQEIKASRQKRKEVADTFGWEENLKRYIPKPTKNAQGALNTEVNIGADFRDVERKKAALFYDTPEVGLTVLQDRELPMPPGVTSPLNLSTLVVWHQELLNALLGPQHANVKLSVSQAIFDCLCPSGVGPVSVGYQVTMRTVERPTPVLDDFGQPVMKPVPAMAQVGAALGLTPPPPPEPLMAMVPVEEPIYERWFVSHSSPKALLLPASWRDTNFQRAPWLGKEWRKPTSQVKREYNLPKDWTAGKDDAQEKPYFEGPDQIQDTDADAGDPFLSGVEIYFRTSLRSETEVHPEAMRQLVLVDGKAEPVVYRDSPHQDFLENGELSKDSLIGFVDRPLVLRDLSDSAWIPSDCAVTAQLTKEGEKYRSQIIEQRDGNKMVIAFDSSKMDPTATDKIKKANGVIWVPLEGNALAQGKDQIMVQVAQPTLGRESYMGMDVIDRDREQILGIAANQTGVPSKGRRTATENSIVQRNSEARFEQERQRVLTWYLDLVGAFDTLVIRYADERIAVQILGETRGKLWAQFKSFLAGGYQYDLQIDSGKYLDVEAERRQWLQLYNQVRPDPHINAKPILKKLVGLFGLDPAELIVDPQPPQQQLKASVTIKGELLDPSLPQFPIYIDLLRQGGWKITEDSVKLAQQQALAQTGGMIPIAGVGPDPSVRANPAHPGGAPKAPTLNQHLADESGEQPGPKVGVM